MDLVLVLYGKRTYWLDDGVFVFDVKERNLIY